MSTVNKYKLLKEISFPGIFCKAETKSIQWEGYYAFPYEGRCFNYGLEGSGWLGNAYLCMNPQDYPDFFELVTDTVPERIRVESIQYVDEPFSDEITILPTGTIPEYKFLAIKQAIEQAINETDFKVGDEVLFDMFEINTKHPLAGHNKIRVKGKITHCLYFKNTAVINFFRPSDYQNEVREFEFSKLTHLTSQPLPTDTDNPLTGDDLLSSESRAFYAGVDGKHKTFTDYKQANLNK